MYKTTVVFTETSPALAKVKADAITRLFAEALRREKNQANESPLPHAFVSSHFSGKESL